jgi:hypothetical protein
MSGNRSGDSERECEDIADVEVAAMLLGLAPAVSSAAAAEPPKKRRRAAKEVRVCFYALYLKFQRVFCPRDRSSVMPNYYHLPQPAHCGL